MSTPPLIAALPQFGQPSTPDALVSGNPNFQALLAQTGGNLGNTDALGASQAGFGNALSLMAPGGGISPGQAQQFGPLFGLIMSLMGGQQ